MIAVVLAAGAGRRLGGAAKALLKTPTGDSYLAAITGVLRSASVTSVVVVVGPPFGEAVAAEAERLGLKVGVNTAAESGGMASSVEVGFRWALEAAQTASRALLWPVDHAFVSAKTVELLRAQHGSSLAVIPTFEGRGGHPVVIERPLWQQLAACATLPEGARSVLRAHSGAVRRLAVHDAAVVRDVDTPEDFP